MHSTWIRPESLDAVLEYLARLVGCQWDPSDRDAVIAGLTGTNDEHGRWFRHEIVGMLELVLELAHDAESPAVLHVRVTAPPQLEREVVTLLDVAGSYSLPTPDRGP
jgi:hypothetical protein